MMVALLSANDEFDYFGYMKKMMLTLHNVRKINKKQLKYSVINDMFNN